MLGDLTGRGQAYEEALELFNGSEEVLFAVMMQNMMHPKNSQRTDAIKSGKYQEFMVPAQAHEFIEEVARTNLTHELRQAQQTVLASFSDLQKSAEFKMIVEAPDVYVAAVALSQTDFYNGRGDRTSFFKIILNLDPRQIPDLGNKLALVKSSQFMGLKLYNDKDLASASRVSQKTLFQLWLHCSRRAQVVTLDQMIAFAPYAEDYLRRQDRYVDAEGRTTLNMEEFMAYRKAQSEKA